MRFILFLVFVLPALVCYGQKNIMDYYKLLPVQNELPITMSNGEWTCENAKTETAPFCTVDLENNFFRLIDEGTGDGFFELIVTLIPGTGKKEVLIAVSKVENDGINSKQQLDFYSFKGKKYKTVSITVPDAKEKFSEKAVPLHKEWDDKYSFIYTFQPGGNVVEIVPEYTYLQFLCAGNIGTGDEEMKYDACEVAEALSLLKWRVVYNDTVKSFDWFTPY